MGQDLQTDEDKVYRSTLASLKVAKELNLKSVAFPAIGTGVGGLSISDCARCMKKAVDEFATDPGTVSEIQFVIFGEDEK